MKKSPLKRRFLLPFEVFYRRPLAWTFMLFIGFSSLLNAQVNDQAPDLQPDPKAMKQRALSTLRTALRRSLGKDTYLGKHQADYLGPAFLTPAPPTRIPLEVSIHETTSPLSELSSIQIEVYDPKTRRHYELELSLTEEENIVLWHSADLSRINHIGEPPIWQIEQLVRLGSVPSLSQRAHGQQPTQSPRQLMRLQRGRDPRERETLELYFEQLEMLEHLPTRREPGDYLYEVSYSIACAIHLGNLGGDAKLPPPRPQTAPGRTRGRELAGSLQ